MTRKQRATIHHFLRFVDRATWPEWSYTDAIGMLFLRYQSEGKKRFTEAELTAIAPFTHAQEMKEVTLQGLIDEMADSWANGFGWWYPIADSIAREFKSRHEHGDRIFIAALIKIARRCNREGFLLFLSSYTGLDAEVTQQKIDRYFDRYDNGKYQCDNPEKHPIASLYHANDWRYEHGRTTLHAKQQRSAACQ